MSTFDPNPGPEQPAPQGSVQYSQPPPADRRDRRPWYDNPRVLIPGALAIGCLPWLILFFVFIGFVVSSAGEGGGGPRVGLIRVSGVITAGRGEGGILLAESAGSESLVRQLEQARKDKSIKSVVLRINSPGGSPAGSEEVYNEINRVRKAGKKVYVSMGDVAASGGYYIASAADRIYADASTITGSIGVIYEGAELTELLKKIGVGMNVITTGKFKDMGNPTRPMTPEERALIKAMLMDTYDQFVTAVSKGRNLPKPKITALADGRVFTGDQARKLRLVDEIGGLRETVLAAGKAGGIKGEPKVKEFRRRGFFESLFNSDNSESSRGVPDALRLQFLKYLLGSDRSYPGMR